MLLQELQYGSLLSYSPYGDSAQAQRSRDIMLTLKRDSFFQSPQILMSKWVAQTIQRNRSLLRFGSFFQPNTLLVPTPKSSLMKQGTLWVPYRLATALMNCGLGKEVALVLKRARPVPKAATSIPKERPLPYDHYQSIEVEKPLSEPDDILLIDDVITRGATLLGAASRLAEVFPCALIRAFAVMRTITDKDAFEKEYSPVIGEITLREEGDTLRRP